MQTVIRLLLLWKECVMEIRDLYDVNRLPTGLTGVRGEKPPQPGLWRRQTGSLVFRLADRFGGRVCKAAVVVGEDGSVKVNVNFDYATSIQGIDWGTASVDALDFFLYDGDNIIPFAVNAGNGQFVDYSQHADIADFVSAVDVSKAAEGVVSVTITPEYASYLAENVGGVYIGADYDLTIGGYATENNVLSTILLAFAE